ncbi:hypothetical protein CEUSTIGMA_g4152.t1 [Chlamydomonas eustigma]|uniref:Uncharacterized protein n=1 Tax=Chlamydomonas eustigma TaxID=1157962 RepID=A0A250X0X9_9CHLO|nr:hypothetical protein CEUSTIGMA_g4152.t1 [Chlamydomonas eustigma]|eukprot:GAX76706.1 hypothetical protein CEUSTIGMA_g4152.t1 [Chlamydomonas eustigma]
MTVSSVLIGRVLAARSSTKAVPLFQGMSQAESLVIGTCTAHMEECHDIKEFGPGFFKYGWYAEPRLFTQKDIDSVMSLHHGPPPRYAPQTTSHRQGKSWRRMDDCNKSSPLPSGERRGSMDARKRSPLLSSGERRGSMDNSKRSPVLLSGERRGSMDACVIKGMNLSAQTENKHELKTLEASDGILDSSEGALSDLIRIRSIGRCQTGPSFKLDVNAPSFSPSH